MKRLLTLAAMFLCCIATSFAQFSGSVNDSQGVKYTANNDESTCYVSGHESNFSGTIVIPESYEGRRVTNIGYEAFRGCSSLTSITIPNSVTNIGSSAFYGCSGLTSVTIPNSVTSIGDRAFEGCSGLTSVTIPNSVTSIGVDAFSGCSGLTNVTIPNSVTSIRWGAFLGCSGLTSVTIPNSVTSIEWGAFNGCSGLTSVTIPNSVTSMESCAFEGCSGLTSVTIGNSVTSIGSVAFYGCSGLTSVTIGNSVTSIGDHAFDGCSGLTSVTIPNSVTSIGGNAFDGCSSLTSITVETGNAVYDSRNNCNAIIKTASNELIVGCKNTVIPNSVTSIGSGAFQSCSSLTSVTIPNSVTSIEGIAFACCSGLTSITIPNSVTSIGWDTFSWCRSLTSIVVGWDDNSIPAVEDLGVDYTKVKLYVPKGTKAAYQAVSPWNGFGTIIEYEQQLDDLAVTDVSAIDNVISMEPFEATKGRETTVSLKMKNTAAIRGFQFDMQLPLGVTVAKNENNRLDCSLNSQRLPENSAHTLTVNELEDGSVRFLCGSQYDETFTGTEGDILTVRLYVDEDMLDGLYKIVLKDVKLSETNIDNYYLTDSLLSAMTVINYTPGDISGDGEIDVSDYIGVANYIMGDTPAGGQLHHGRHTCGLCSGSSRREQGPEGGRERLHRHCEHDTL